MYNHLSFISPAAQEEMNQVLAAVVAATAKKEGDAQQKHSDALDRERAKRDRLVSVQHDERMLALEHLRRKLDNEWHTILSDLRKQLGAVQTELVQSQMREGRAAKRVRKREEASNLQALTVLNELSV